MSESVIRADIKAIIESVASIGVVHDYWRYASDWETYVNFFKDTSTNRIYGWQIERTGTKIDVNENTGESYKKTHTYQITGFMSLLDAIATEKLFNAAIESVVDRMLYPYLTGTTDATEACKLKDADADFAKSLVGKTVNNVTKNTAATIVAFVNSGDLSIDDDIFESGDAYSINLEMSDTEYFSTPQVTRIGTWVFGDVLCHKVTITWPIMEISSQPDVDAEDLITLGIEYFLKPGDAVVDASDILTVS